MCSSGVSSDEDLEMQGGAVRGAIKLSSRDKLALADAIKHGNASELDATLPTKGLFALPFMRRAMQREGAELAEQAQALLDAEKAVDALPAGAGEALEPARRAFGGAVAPSAAGQRDMHGSGSDSDSGNEDEDTHARQQRRNVSNNGTQDNAAQSPVSGERRSTSAPVRKAQAQGKTLSNPDKGGGDGAVVAALPAKAMMVRYNAASLQCHAGCCTSSVLQLGRLSRLILSHVFHALDVLAGGGATHRACCSPARERWGDLLASPSSHTTSCNQRQSSFSNAKRAGHILGSKQGNRRQYC